MVQDWESFLETEEQSRFPIIQLRYVLGYPQIGVCQTTSFKSEQSLTGAYRVINIGEETRAIP